MTTYRDARVHFAYRNVRKSCHRQHFRMIHKTSLFNFSSTVVTHNNRKIAAKNT